MAVIRYLLPVVFAPAAGAKADDSQELVGQLHEKIGQLTVEVDWLKKKCKQLGL